MQNLPPSGLLRITRRMSSWRPGEATQIYLDDNFVAYLVAGSVFSVSAFEGFHSVRLVTDTLPDLIVQVFVSCIQHNDFVFEIKTSPALHHEVIFSPAFIQPPAPNGPQQYSAPPPVATYYSLDVLGIVSIVLAVLGAYLVYRQISLWVSASAVLVGVCAVLIRQRLSAFSVIGMVFGIVAAVAFLVVPPGVIRGAVRLSTYSASREKIQAEAVTVSYDDLTRHPDTYRGKYVVIRVQIFTQFRKDSLSNCYYYVGLDDSATLAGVYAGNMYGFSPAKWSERDRIVEGDTLEIYGVFAGTAKMQGGDSGLAVDLPIIDVIAFSRLQVSS